MSNSVLPTLDSSQLQQLMATLTQPRLSKYLRASRNNDHQALLLYVLNTKVSAAFLADLHYVEVALRNKFDRELCAGFSSPEWFKEQTFLALLDGHNQRILRKAQNDVEKHWSRGCPVPPGKVIAELSFGFWHKLTESRLEHPLWVPYLHKAFRPRKPPKRATFNQQLEKLRQLRNRIAHHEPIFHLELMAIHQALHEVAQALCPTTAAVILKTSTVHREVVRISSYCKRHRI